jgi:AcrR family transcriptional regulator
MAQAKKSSTEELSIPERRRLEIIQAAYKIFSERGYYATKVEDITSELGIAYGLFYRYFDSKLDIISQIIDMLIERINQTVVVEACYEPKNREEFLEHGYRLGELLLSVLTDDPYMSKFLFYEALGIDEETNEKINQAFDIFGQYNRLYLEKGIREGFLRDDMLIDETAYAMNAMIFEGARRVMRAKNKAKAKRNWVKAVWELLLEGIEKSPR